MKRNLLTMVLLCLSIFLLSCGKNITVNADEGQVQTNTDDDVSEEISKDEDKQENVEQDSGSAEIELPNIFRAYDSMFYANAPDYQTIELGCVELYKVGDIKYITITTNILETATNAKEAQALAFDLYKTAMDSNLLPNSMNITSDEELTVNDMEVYRFEGTLNCGRDTLRDIYAVGYSFVVDEVPCMILGAVGDDAQSQDVIDEVTAIVDAMIYTVRDEK